MYERQNLLCFGFLNSKCVYYKFLLQCFMLSNIFQIESMRIMAVCLCLLFLDIYFMSMNALPGRRHSMPWNWNYECCEPSCGCWKLDQVFCKNSHCFQPLRLFRPLGCFCFETGFLTGLEVNKYA